MSAFTEPQRGPPRQPCRPPIANHHKLGRRDSDVEDPPAQMPAGQRSPKGPAPPSENWVFCRASRCASDYAPFPAQASSIAAELPHTELSRGNRQTCQLRRRLRCGSTRVSTARILSLGRMMATPSLSQRSLRLQLQSSWGERKSSALACGKPRSVQSGSGLRRRNGAKNGWHNSTDSACKTCGPAESCCVRLKIPVRLLSACGARSMKVLLISMLRHWKHGKIGHSQRQIGSTQCSLVKF